MDFFDFTNTVNLPASTNCTRHHHYKVNADGSRSLLATKVFGTPYFVPSTKTISYRVTVQAPLVMTIKDEGGIYPGSPMGQIWYRYTNNFPLTP